MKIYRRAFIPDCHFPFHDAKAFEIAMQIIEDFKPDEVIILGDFSDCYCVSQYTKSPEHNFNLLKDELVEGQEALTAMARRSKAKSFVYLEGNHENRITRYVNTYGAKLGGLVDTKAMLKIPAHWKYLPYGQKGHYKCGNWIITHGTICNKHVAASMVSKYGANVLFGHTHRIQEFHISNYHGEDMRAITCGWLGDKERAAEYISNVADWSHGLACGYFLPSGKGFVQTITIDRYEAVFEGKVYR